MESDATRSDDDVRELRERKSGAWPAIRLIHRRRPLLTAIVVIAAPLHTLATAAEPLDLLDPSEGGRFWAAWVLMLVGVAARLWGSGNLRKNQEITNSGIYELVRHPLYFGSLCFFLAFFVTVGDIVVGLALFVLLAIGIYVPTMLGEEEYLIYKFPGQFTDYRPPPRLFPDVRRLRAALDSDRFDMGTAYRNLGFRSAWFLLALPVFLELLGWADQRVGR